ncbi:MAG: aspartoacylase [Pelatocladus maniniholoensis HA4357-MV3]|jgi:succinylglutamate desuccinylase|uniref:Probable aspartoacylase n=1 Tax=Pelatocladus maniniholoensis HA4357-MV3 TaxID=1117104 RepID=A0A9E3HAR6_9NOST|nr:aspartoacylase [Pelatocladus maniniholoensis HA4357-MV3]BAZ66235.1 aspartoacylase [Fischerella sp. NIES-4106]
MNQINQVAIVGATHGNEFTGGYLLKKFEQFPHLIRRTSFETQTLLANPEAFKLGKRYIDKDLNRCFLSQDLQNSTLSSYEDIRAKAINKILGPKDNPQVDVILDLHSTTANMGLSIIIGNKNPFCLQLSAYLSAINPLVKVCLSSTNQASSLLKSLCQCGFVIEVGPIAQGVLNADLFLKTESLIYTILDYLEAYNQNLIPETYDELTLYQDIGTIDYPRNNFGEIQAMIHPQLQFRDYEPLHPGDPIFLSFDGQEITYKGDSIIYPIFINEAAYYEKGIAMRLTKKQELINISTLTSHD